MRYHVECVPNNYTLQEVITMKGISRLLILAAILALSVLVTGCYTVISKSSYRERYYPARTEQQDEDRDDREEVQAEYEDELRRRKAEAELGKRPATFGEAKEIAAGEAGKRERQAEILEREAERRGVSVEDLSPEVKEAVTEQALVEEEDGGVLQEIANAYTYVDTLGGIIPKEAQDQLIMGTLPVGGPGGLLGVKSGKAILNTAKVTTTLRATRAWEGMLKLLKNKIALKLGAYGTVGYAYFTEKTLSNIDSALSQVRESITLPVSLAAVNPTANVRIAFDQITDLEDDVREYESMVKVREPFTPSAIVGGRTLPIYQRIKKLDAAIELARQQISNIEAMDRTPTDEEVIIMLDEMNKILNEMEDPDKFLGFI